MTQFFFSQAFVNFRLKPLSKKNKDYDFISNLIIFSNLIS